jgi:hypothetical protein
MTEIPEHFIGLVDHTPPSPVVFEMRRLTREVLLKEISTRELLADYRARFYADSDGMVHLSRMIKGGFRVGHSYTPEEIKAELNSRPHVPNKREARGLRLKKIRKGV